MLRRNRIPCTTHTYDPERFLKDGKLGCSVKDSEGRVFGTGRQYGSAPKFSPSLALRAQNFVHDLAF